MHARNPRASADEADAFRAEATLACELGFDATFMTTVPFAGGPGIRFHDQARVHPGRYLAGIARAFTEAGGQIFEHSDAEEFRETPLGVNRNREAVGPTRPRPHFVTGTRGSRARSRG